MMTRRDFIVRALMLSVAWIAGMHRGDARRLFAACDPGEFNIPYNATWTAGSGQITNMLARVSTVSPTTITLTWLPA